MTTRTRTTYTVATLEVSSATYDEVAELLRAAEYGHAFIADGVIDMTGIGLKSRESPRGRGGPRGFLEEQAEKVDELLAELRPGDAAFTGGGCTENAFGGGVAAVRRMRDLARHLPDRWTEDVVRTLADAIRKVLPDDEVDRLIASLDPDRPLLEFLACLRGGAAGGAAR